MRLTDLLFALFAAGIRLAVEDDGLLLTGKTKNLTAELRETLTASKPVLLLLLPYADLIALAERNALSPVVVGISGQDVTLNAAVLHAQSWLLYSLQAQDDPYVDDLQAECLRVLETIQQYVASETNLLEVEQQERSLRAGREVVFVMCRELGGEEICLAADGLELPLDASGCYRGHVVYRVNEIDRLRESKPSPSVLQTIHEIKKQFGGEIVLPDS